MQSTSKPSVRPERAAQIDTLVLHRKSHSSFERGHCFMEAVSWLAGEPFTDEPQCVCPVIGAYMRSWNDRLSDAQRTELLRPLLLEVIGTHGSDRLARRRRYAIVDTTIRTVLPMMLHALKLDELAVALEALPEIVDEPTQLKAREHCMTLHASLANAAYAYANAAAAAAYAAYADAAAAAAHAAYADAAAAAAHANAAVDAAAVDARSKLQQVQVDLVRRLCVMVEEP